MMNTIIKSKSSQSKTMNFLNLEEMIREKAGEMINLIFTEEVNEFVEQFKEHTDSSGLRKVVRNGYSPERFLQTAMGPLKIKVPRVDDRKMEDQPSYKRFSISILPRYARATPTLDVAIPYLYLKGISTGDMEESLKVLFGNNLTGFSAQTICRLKEQWESDYTAWMKRSFSGKNYPYIWVDGIHMSVQMEDEKSCLLVVLGADEHGNKEILTIVEGFRESSESWKEVLRGLKERGLANDPKLAIGDGALGFWAAVQEIFPTTKIQRCWVHKVKNVLDKVHKSVQIKAKTMLREVVTSPNRAEAEKAVNNFNKYFEDKYPKATECLNKDKEALLSFLISPPHIGKVFVQPIRLNQFLRRCDCEPTKPEGCVKEKLYWL